MSWFDPDPRNPIVKFIYVVTEPVLKPLRAIIPPVMGGIDITPMVVILIIYFILAFLV